MGRPRNTGLESARSRSGLSQRTPAYWARLSEGKHLGYRKGLTSGHWLARAYDLRTKTRIQKALGEADDNQPADGETVLTFDQAKARAEAWFTELARNPAPTLAQARENELSRLTVIQAVEAYLDYLQAEKKGGKQAEQAARKYILSCPIGERRVVDLTREEIDGWRKALTAAPRSTRAKPRLGPVKSRPRRKKMDGTERKQPPKGKWELEAESLSPDALAKLMERRRKSTSNRVLTILKSALNRLRQKHPNLDDRPWRDVKPYRNADGARTEILEVEEQRRLLEACPPGLKELVAGALLTGARYGELAAMRVGQVFPRTCSIRIEDSKTDRPRVIPLSNEGAAFFAKFIEGKRRTDLLFVRSDGTPWGKSLAFRPFRAACDAAKVPPIAFHELRHSYASNLIMAGAELKAVAEALGHASTVMVEKHYGHLRQGWLQKQIDTYAPKLFEQTEPAAIAQPRPKKIGRIEYCAEGGSVKTWREEG